jgi:hypothetical protein
MRFSVVIISVFLLTHGSMARSQDPESDSMLRSGHSDNTSKPAARTAGYSLMQAEDLFDASSMPPPPPGFRPADDPICRIKKQALQNVAVSGGWLQATGSNDLSNSFFTTSISLGIPLGSVKNILGVTPSFRMDWMDAGPGIEIPSTLYETGVSFYWQKPFNDRWSLMLLGGPSVRSDFTTSDKAIRLFGLGLLTWQAKADILNVSMGVVYLGRADLPALPAVGLTWTPSPERKIDLKFPTSTLWYRMEKDGHRSETWAYASAGFGGNTWAVTRTSGSTDELSTSDLRVTFGMEKIVDGGGGWYAEFGYAFNRYLKYEKMQTEIALNDGVLLRAGWKY